MKPSNILVTIENDQPVPKIIDLGIAKALTPTATDRTVYTQYGAVLGSMDYVSPEQAEGAADVDTRADIYSLGAVLYQLLIGTTPLPLTALSVTDAERIIRDRDVPSLSTRIKNMGEVAEGVAKKRRQTLAALQRRVNKKLDWITRKALEKDRSRRYTSASEFAADIDRYLNDEVVLAGPISLRALGLIEKVGVEHPRVAWILNDFAKLHALQGRNTEAEGAFRRALSIRESKLGQDHPDVAVTLEDYAAFLRDNGQLEEATRFAEQASAIKEQLTAK